MGTENIGFHDADVGMTTVMVQSDASFSTGFYCWCPCGSQYFAIGGEAERTAFDAWIVTHRDHTPEGDRHGN